MLSFVFLIPFSTGRANAQTVQEQPRQEQNVVSESTNFRGAEIGISLCKILRAASQTHYQASESDGAVTIAARLSMLKHAEELKEQIAIVPNIEAIGNPRIERRTDGTFDVSFNGQVATRPSKAAVLKVELSRDYVNPIEIVNQAGLDSDLTFEKFWPSEQVDVGLYKLTTVQFAVSGTCEQFVTMLERLRQQAGAINLLSNQFVFESELPRPLRWTAILKLKSKK